MNEEVEMILLIAALVSFSAAMILLYLWRRERDDVEFWRDQSHFWETEYSKLKAAVVEDDRKWHLVVKAWQTKFENLQNEYRGVIDEGDYWKRGEPPPEYTPEN